MSDGKSIINIDLGGVSDVGRALIEKVADAIGGLYKPHQIVRLAQAQAKADLISATAQLEIEALQRRAIERFVIEEAKKQSNIEEITHKAVPLLEDKSQPAKVEDDWITNFFDKCRLISDEEMQNLWAKILAGEVNGPGNFSKRTVNLVADLDKRDAELFRMLCGYVWNIGGLTPVIYDYKDDIYARNGISFDALTHLESIGLIQFDFNSDFVRVGIPDELTVVYRETVLVLKRQSGANANLRVGKALLTKAGKELTRISTAEAVPGFYDYVVEKLRSQRFLPPISEIS